MKKLLYTTALMFVSATVFTSCVDLQTYRDYKEKQEEMQVEVEYSVKCTQDVLDALDLVIIYKDKGGVNATDTVRDTLWTKTVVHDSVPAKAGLNWSVTPKPGSKLNKDTLDIDATYSLSYNGRTLDFNAYMMTYHDFPVSRLQTLCEVINLERRNFVEHVEKNCHYYPCYIIKPGIYQDLESEPTDWDDK